MSNQIKTSSPLKILGEYRAQVTQVDLDGNKYGAVRVFIPELMLEGVEPGFGSENYGIYAYPGNNPMGGYNPNESDANYAGSMMVPLKGSWVKVKFENGAPDQCVYTGPHNLKHSTVPPENQGVAEPHKVYTIAKGGSGRSFVICDSEDQARVEISGKRRMLSGDAAGEGGVYNIMGNMNTILIDERDGKQKILLATCAGDYIHLDIDERMLQIFTKNDIRLQTLGQIHINAGKGIVVNGKSLNMKFDKDVDINSKNMKLTQSGDMNIKSKGLNKVDGMLTLIQNGLAIPATPGIAIPPQGARGT